MKKVVITGSFDDLRSRHIRLLEEAAKLGRLHVRLWSDKISQAPGTHLPYNNSFFKKALKYTYA